MSPIQVQERPKLVFQAKEDFVCGVIYLTFLHITQKYTFNANKLHIEHELTRPTFATNIFRRCTLAVLLVWNGFKDIKKKNLKKGPSLI